MSINTSKLVYYAPEIRESFEKILTWLDIRGYSESTIAKETERMINLLEELGVKVPAVQNGELPNDYSMSAADVEE